MKKILFLLPLISSINFAVAQEQPKQFTFTVNSEELQIIGNALEELPFKKSAPLLNKLNTQVQQQLRPVQKPDTKIEDQK